jgi:hypothetical protein
VLVRYLDDPAVAQAVTFASEQDPSETVRHEARRRLEQWKTGQIPPGR